MIEQFCSQHHKLIEFKDYLSKRMHIIKYAEQICKDAIDPSYYLSKDEFKHLFVANSPPNFVLKPNEVFDIIIKKYPPL